jgi:hypothetical protein
MQAEAILVKPVEIVVESEQLVLVPEAKQQTDGVDGVARDKEVARKTRWKKTQPAAAAKAAFIEEFVTKGELAKFPVEPEDLADENRERGASSTLWLLLTEEVERAFRHSARPPPVTASFFANLLLTSHDAQHGCDVVNLPATAMEPARILAHVLSAPVRLDPRVAASVARRTSLCLLNRARWVGGPEAEAARGAGLVTEPDADERPREPLPRDMCMDCGVEYVAGAEHRCAVPEPAPVKVRAPQVHPAGLAPTLSPPKSDATGRVVVGYARTKVPQTFFRAAGIGVQGDFVEMPAHIVLEVLETNAMDRADQKRQAELDGRQLVVVRWRNQARLLFNSSLDRVDREAFLAYEREINVAAAHDDQGGRSSFGSRPGTSVSRTGDRG